jgi:hypothetical protein
MKVRKSLVLASLAGGLGLAGATVAQPIIYNNTTNPLGFYFAVIDPASNPTSGPETGDEVTFGGESRELAEIRILFVSAVGSGAADTRVRFYEPDGPGGAPGTVLWDSNVMPALPHIAGNNELVVAVPPNIWTGETVIWTVHWTNRTGSTGGLGTRFFDPPTVGSSENEFWGKDFPGFPGWTPLWFGATGPVSNWGARITATGNVRTGACCLPNGTCEALTNGACIVQQGLYQGDNVPCGSVICRDPGACCLRDGTCILTAQHVCEGQAGTYRGDGVACGPAANCPIPGACCFPDNSCSITSENQCVNAGGNFNGAGTICGVVTCWQPPVLFNNGPLSTGEFTSTFIQAPPGTTWTETQGEPGCQNLFSGYGAAAPALRLADNFVIPSGANWQFQKVEIFGFRTFTPDPGPTPPPSPFIEATLRIWNGVPGEPGSMIVWGDETTNRMTATSFANMFSPTTPISHARPIYKLELAVDANLAPGTYWVDYSFRTTPEGGAFTPPVKVIGSRGPDGANARQRTAAGGPYNLVVDAGSCDIPRRQEVPFIIYGTTGGPVCYANCDGSTTPPILNVEDFTCFINQFAAGTQLPHSQQLTHYANCDQSTTAPVLNVEDFTCFINRFAQGCN